MAVTWHILVVMCGVGVLQQTASAAPPPSPLELRVTARQWNWTFEYPADDIVSQTLAVPVNRPIKLTMTSLDVLHVFSVPTLGLEEEIAPGREQAVQFLATEVGTHKVVCAKYCGKDHSRMVTTIEVMTQAKYDEWIATGGNPELAKRPLAEIGQHHYRAYGCNQCHSTDGSPSVGPTFKGLYGKKGECLDGPCEVTEDYIRESIENPTARVARGFPSPWMPSYKGKVKTASPPNYPNDPKQEQTQMKAIIAFLKSLR